MPRARQAGDRRLSCRPDQADPRGARRHDGADRRPSLSGIFAGRTVTKRRQEGLRSGRRPQELPLRAVRQGGGAAPSCRLRDGKRQGDAVLLRRRHSDLQEGHGRSPGRRRTGQLSAGGPLPGEQPRFRRRAEAGRVPRPGGGARGAAGAPSRHHRRAAKRYRPGGAARIRAAAEASFPSGHGARRDRRAGRPSERTQHRRQHHGLGGSIGPRLQRCRSRDRQPLIRRAPQGSG